MLPDMFDVGALMRALAGVLLQIVAVVVVIVAFLLGIHWLAGAIIENVPRVTR